MAVCEYHCEYTTYLNRRISNELVPHRFPEDLDWNRVWSIVQNAAICEFLENISSREAELIYQSVFCLYPQFEEELKSEMQKHFG